MLCVRLVGKQRQQNGEPRMERKHHIACERLSFSDLGLILDGHLPTPIAAAGNHAHARRWNCW